MPMLESVLFLDPQAAVPVCFCEVCGGERYAPGLNCICCERRSGNDDDGTESEL